MVVSVIDDQFEYFIKTTYPSDFESMAAKYPDQPLQELWPEQWAVFEFMTETFNSLIAENAKLDRERNLYRKKADGYKARSDLARDVITQHFKWKLGEPEQTLKAVQGALVGYGEP